jgi:hypothetical protein
LGEKAATTPAANVEPGPTVATAEACKTHLKYYEEGQPPNGKPCEEANYKKITQELGCSDKDKAKADDIRVRCSKPSPKKNEDEKKPCGYGEVKPSPKGGVDYECVKVTNTCAHGVSVRYKEYDAGGKLVNSTGTECVPKETTKLTDTCVVKGDRKIEVENPAVSCGTPAK